MPVLFYLAVGGVLACEEGRRRQDRRRHERSYLCSGRGSESLAEFFPVVIALLGNFGFRKTTVTAAFGVNCQDAVEVTKAWECSIAAFIANKSGET